MVVSHQEATDSLKRSGIIAKDLESMYALSIVRKWTRYISDLSITVFWCKLRLCSNECPKVESLWLDSSHVHP